MTHPDQRIRVLLLLPSLHGGGAERVAVNLLKHFDRSRFDLRMGLLRRAGPYLNEVDPQLLDVSPLGAEHLDFEQGNSAVYQPLTMLKGIGLVPANVLAMLRRFRPHVAMSFRKGMNVAAYAGVRLYGRSKLAWIAREGNNTLAVIDDELKNAMARRAIVRLTGHCYGAANRLLTSSEEMGRALQSDLGIPAATVHSIHNAVDLATIRKQARESCESPAGEGTPYIIAVGRLEWQKGVDTLLEAYAGSAVRRTHRLVLVGEGKLEAQLRAQAAELEVADRVVFAGWRENPWAWMAAADAFVLPSRWEGFGNVVVEALAAGVPAIVSDCPFGPREIVRHEESGWVVPMDDAAALQGAIDTIVSSKETAGRLRENGQRRAEDFDVPVIVNKYQRLFAQVAAEVHPELRS